MTGFKRLALVMILVALSGCAASPKENLPTVPWQTHADALDHLRRQTSSVQTVTATGDITLSRGGGDSVRLDLAMVSRRRDHLRLRAWKMGQAVFDLTLTPEGLWLFTPEDPSMKQRARAGGLDAASLARSWAMFTGGLFERSDLVIRDEGDFLIITAPSDSAAITCRVDRRTLTLRSYEVKDSQANVRFMLQLSHYRLIDGIAFSFRYDARSDRGTIRVDLREVELNSELADGAFSPPRRAEKIQ